jgi:hypothetical protein
MKTVAGEEFQRGLQDNFLLVFGGYLSHFAT